MNDDEIKEAIEHILPNDDSNYESESDCLRKILYNKVCNLLKQTIFSTCCYYMRTSPIFDYREYCDSLLSELKDLLPSSTFIDEEAQKIADECLRRVNKVFDIKSISNKDEANPKDQSC